VAPRRPAPRLPEGRRCRRQRLLTSIALEATAALCGSHASGTARAVPVGRVEYLGSVREVLQAHVDEVGLRIGLSQDAPRKQPTSPASSMVNIPPAAGKFGLSGVTQRTAWLARAHAHWGCASKNATRSRASSHESLRSARSRVSSPLVINIRTRVVIRSGQLSKRGPRGRISQRRKCTLQANATCSRHVDGAGCGEQIAGFRATGRRACGHSQVRSSSARRP
jgi:hypothetical protein